MARKPKLVEATDIAAAESRRNDLEAAFVEQLERLLQQQEDLAADMQALKEQIKDSGLQPKLLTAVAKLRRESYEKREEREEFEQQRDQLVLRLGVFGTTALGRAAIDAT